LAIALLPRMFDDATPVTNPCASTRTIGIYALLPDGSSVKRGGDLDSVRTGKFCLSETIRRDQRWQFSRAAA
jgi:hypothetical protein